MDADSFLDHIVAHARVGACINALESAHPFTSKHRYALTQLEGDIQKGGSYVEEAVRLDVTGVMTKLMKRCADDEALMDQISHIIALCSGPMACAGRVLTFSYEGASVRIREGPLGDGLGARVWAIAHALCREMAASPQAVRGLDVLEIGAGTGICGIAAAKLGARRVVLTDNELEVLFNLRTCMHLNCDSGGGGSDCVSSAPAGSGGGDSGAGGEGARGEASGGAGASKGDAGGVGVQNGGGGGGGDGGGGFHGVTDEELFDDADSVDEDFDFSALVVGPSGIGGGGGAGAGGNDDVRRAAARAEWEAGNMEVRLLDWSSSLEALDGSHEPAVGCVSGAGPSGGGASSSGSGGERGASEGWPPGVPLSERFPVILANETMYEPEHAVLVAAVIAHRLAPGGRALLCSAVRFKEVFETFERCCAARGLRHRAVVIQPRPEDCDGGILRDDYDGGFRMIAVDFAAHPSPDWHRDDFE